MQCTANNQHTRMKSAWHIAYITFSSVFLDNLKLYERGCKFHPLGDYFQINQSINGLFRIAAITELTHSDTLNNTIK